MDNNQRERNKLLVKNVKRDPAPNTQSKGKTQRPDVLRVIFRNEYGDYITEILNKTGSLTLSEGETNTLLKILRDAKGGK